MNRQWKEKLAYECKCLAVMLVAVCISSISLHFFVIPAKFSPSGIDGVSTLLYEITNINIGWFKLAFNFPLLILALIFLNKRYVCYISLFTILDSVGVILLDVWHFPVLIPQGLTPEGALPYRLLAAIFAGVALGVTTGLMLKIGFSTGGVDIIASIIHQKNSHIHTERIIGILCFLVIFLSYFVYWNIISILLSVIQICIFEITTFLMLKGDRYAVEVKIITKNPKKIEQIILERFEHSATVLKGEGMFTGDTYSMVVTLMTEGELASFRKLTKREEDLFIYCSGEIRMIQGDFRFNKHNITP